MGPSGEEGPQAVGGLLVVCFLMNIKGCLCIQGTDILVFIYVEITSLVVCLFPS